MKFQELVEKATQLQAEIMELDARAKSKQAEINDLPLIKELAEIEKEKLNKINLYRGFTKESLGLVDNEQTNVLEIAKAIKKIASYD